MNNAQRATMTKEELKIIDAYEFEKRTDEKALRRQIQELVDLAKNVRKEELAEKREKLRALFSKEQAEFEQEYMAFVHAKVHNDIQERTNRLVEIQKEHGKEVKQMLELKKVQQYMSSCDDIRLKLRNELLNDTKQGQLIQIEEKRLKALEEKEHKRIWEEVAQRRSDELARMDECKALRKQEQMLRDREVLQKQVEYAKQLQEDLRREEMEDRIKAEEKLKAELELEKLALAGEAGKRLQQSKLLQKQLLEAMQLKKQRVENEIAYDRMFEQAIDAQYKREQAELAARVSTLRQATLTYLKYLSDLKHERKIADCELENALLEYQMKSNEKKEKMFLQNKAKKAADAKKAHAELLKQICDNRIRVMNEKEQECLDAMKDRERWECEERKERDRAKAREEFALSYGVELKEQVAAINAFKAEQEKKFELDLEKAAKDDLHCEQMMYKFMSGDVQYLKPHPNWNLMSCSCIKN